MAKNFWNDQYIKGNTGWDIGYVSTPLKEYFDKLTDKSSRILIPGAGSGYEVEYLYRCGFQNVYLLDISNIAIEKFSIANPDFPKENLINEDFFIHEGKYDLIIEQTFFCSLHPGLRWDYVRKVHSLLNENGKLVGLLFDDPLNLDHPPYGGSKSEYEQYFIDLFRFKVYEKCYNSIKPRAGREIFFIFEKLSSDKI